MLLHKLLSPFGLERAFTRGKLAHWLTLGIIEATLK